MVTNFRHDGEVITLIRSVVWHVGPPFKESEVTSYPSPVHKKSCMSTEYSPQVVLSEGFFG